MYYGKYFGWDEMAAGEKYRNKDLERGGGMIKDKGENCIKTTV